MSVAADVMDVFFCQCTLSTDADHNICTGSFSAWMCNLDSL